MNGKIHRRRHFVPMKFLQMCTSISTLCKFPLILSTIIQFTVCVMRNFRYYRGVSFWWALINHHLGLNWSGFRSVYALYMAIIRVQSEYFVNREKRSGRFFFSLSHFCYAKLCDALKRVSWSHTFTQFTHNHLKYIIISWQIINQNNLTWMNCQLLVLLRSARALTRTFSNCSTVTPMQKAIAEFNKQYCPPTATYSRKMPSLL